LFDSPNKVRAFVAIRVSAHVEHSIEDFIIELRSHNDGIKSVSAANLHLTLKFLGPAVPFEKIHRLQPELEKLAAVTDAFELEAIEVGGFPDLKHPLVLWVGLRAEALGDLATRVDDAASRCGFEREQRAFRGHLTIARLKRPRLGSETRARIEAASGHNFGTSTIRAMTLYRSITKPAGPIYEVLQDFRFHL
jgi:RNA 2',3'-cyclic 3'-phosphodiesterase